MSRSFQNSSIGGTKEIKGQHFGLETALTMDNTVMNKRPVFSPLSRSGKKSTFSG